MISPPLMNETGEGGAFDAARARLLGGVESFDQEQDAEPEMERPVSAAPMPAPPRPAMPPETSIFEPLPTGPSVAARSPAMDAAMIDPAVLPRAEDRAIAARRSGIAGLV